MAILDWIFPILTFFLFLGVGLLFGQENAILAIAWIPLFCLTYTIFAGIRYGKKVLKILPLILIISLSVIIPEIFIILLGIVGCAYAPFVLNRYNNRKGYSFKVFFILLTIFCILMLTLGGLFSGSKQKLSITAYESRSKISDVTITEDNIVTPWENEILYHKHFEIEMFQQGWQYLAPKDADSLRDAFVYESPYSGYNDWLAFQVQIADLQYLSFYDPLTNISYHVMALQQYFDYGGYTDTERFNPDLPAFWAEKTGYDHIVLVNAFDTESREYISTYSEYAPVNWRSNYYEFQIVGFYDKIGVIETVAGDVPNMKQVEGVKTFRLYYGRIWYREYRDDLQFQYILGQDYLNHYPTYTGPTNPPSGEDQYGPGQTSNPDITQVWNPAYVMGYIFTGIISLIYSLQFIGSKVSIVIQLLILGEYDKAARTLAEISEAFSTVVYSGIGLWIGVLIIITAYDLIVSRDTKNIPGRVAKIILLVIFLAFLDYIFSFVEIATGWKDVISPLYTKPGEYLLKETEEQLSPYLSLISITPNTYSFQLNMLNLFTPSGYDAYLLLFPSFTRIYLVIILFACIFYNPHGDYRSQFWYGSKKRKKRKKRNEIRVNNIKNLEKYIKNTKNQVKKLEDLKRPTLKAKKDLKNLERDLSTAKKMFHGKKTEKHYSVKPAKWDWKFIIFLIPLMIFVLARVIIFVVDPDFKNPIILILYLVISAIIIIGGRGLLLLRTGEQGESNWSKVKETLVYGGLGTILLIELLLILMPLTNSSPKLGSFVAADVTAGEFILESVFVIIFLNVLTEELIFRAIFTGLFCRIWYRFRLKNKYLRPNDELIIIKQAKLEKIKNKYSKQALNLKNDILALEYDFRTPIKIPIREFAVPGLIAMTISAFIFGLFHGLTTLEYGNIVEIFLFVLEPRFIITASLGVVLGILAFYNFNACFITHATYNILVGVLFA